MASDAEVNKPREVRVFATGVDTDTLVATVLVQPSLYMGFANMALMFLSQRFPEEFLPPSLLHKKYNGIRLQRMTAVPFCAATMFYLAAASGASSTRPLGGHLGGFCTSMILAVGFMSARKVSWYYPLLSIMYFSFGSFHHYRKLSLHSCNAPIYQWGDASKIWNHWRGERRKAKEELQRRKEKLRALSGGS